jgi:sugar phosphate isomerase/epimerase
MIPGISTQIFYPRRLRPGLLDTLAGSGAGVIELFAGRHHFDYADRSQVREVAGWFAANDVRPTLHAPISSDSEFSRHASPNLNLVSSEKGRRIEAMEEIKRALECAEHIRIATCVLHLGLQDHWSEHVLEYALTAVEHLKAFAAPLGVRLLLENLRNEVATPEHLLEILRVGHFDTCGICLDVGHAHLTDEPMEKTFELLRSRVLELHLSDNHGPDGGRGDEHLWPASGQSSGPASGPASGTERPASAARGTLDWNTVYGLIATLPETTPGVLEIADTQVQPAEDAGRMAREVFAWQARLAEARAEADAEVEAGRRA